MGGFHRLVSLFTMEASINLLMGFEALSETSNKITTNGENIEENNNEENIDESM
uniref:Uncharacterized protein n=1 Tax=Meloidogyne incognita TaxID=6306 RepID=A0A914M276_MELIC